MKHFLFKRLLKTQSLALFLLSLPFFVVDQPPLVASDQSKTKTVCLSHWAIGWYINKETGEQSKEFDGRLTHCSGGEFTADIFDAPNWLSTTNFVCHSRSSTSEGMCSSSRKLNQTYAWGLILNTGEGNNIQPGKVKHLYPYQNSMESRTTCAQAYDSVYEYCFKQGKPIIARSNN